MARNLSPYLPTFIKRPKKALDTNHVFGLYGLVKIYQPKVLNHTIHKLLIYTDTHIHMKTNVCV